MINKVIIGVAGYMGSGKSTLTRRWSELFGFGILDADQIAKELMNSDEQIIAEIGAEFGAVRDGKIDFAVLGPIVFADPNQLHKLNSIVHPPLILHLNELAHTSTTSLFIDAALIPLWGSALLCDKRIWIESDHNVRLTRIIDRTGLSVDQCQVRLVRQEKLFAEPASDGQEWLFVNNDNELEHTVVEGYNLLTLLISGISREY